jgi:biopolymer transport protein ExbB
MWPLLLLSVVAVAVVLERMAFIIKERRSRDLGSVSFILEHVEHGDITTAIESAKFSNDFVARVLVYGLVNRDRSFSSALLIAANRELKRFGKGLPTLDTIITLAPLLGLLGTVTGMIDAFGLFGVAGTETTAVITGGISEALIATAFGLIIACLSLIPFNYLNKRVEDARHEIEDAATHMELLLIKNGSKSE